MPHIGNFPPKEYPKPLVIQPSAFIPREDTFDWFITEKWLKSGGSFNEQRYIAPFTLPQGATITRLTLFAYRDDGAASISVSLYRSPRQDSYQGMGNVIADWTDGNNSKYNESIDYPVIDNENYAYSVSLALNPNDFVGDVIFSRIQIDWT